MEYVEELQASTTKATRTVGLKKLNVVGLKTPFVKIINHKAFLLYKKTGMTKPLQKELEAVFFEIKKEDPKRNIYVGRAYYVPGFPNPPGPRFVAGDTKEIVKRVSEHFNFARQNKYDSKPGAQIGVILHPWINPKIPLGGGCVTLADNGQKKIVIEAIFGIDEGVQSFPHDFYIVDFNSQEIIERVIAEKQECLEVNEHLQVNPVVVPRQYRLKPVLDDKTILTIARDFKKFVQRYGPHRLEYAAQKEGVYYRECVPFVVTKQKTPDVHEEGKVFRLNTKSDLPKIGARQRVIFVDPVVIKKRQMNLLTFLATHSRDKKIILYPGSASTGHAATIFRETGHLVVFIGNQIFKDGDKVLVETKNGELVVERL